MTDDQGGADHTYEMRDAALGAAAVVGGAAASVAGMAGGAARAVGGSRLGKLVGSVTKPVMEPLADAGREFRDDVAEEAPVQRIAEEVVHLVIASLDLNELLATVDLGALLARLDIDALVTRVDIDAILSRVDIAAILARVDVNEIVARVDIDAILAGVDVNEIVARVDIDAILARVDVNEIVARVDIDAIIDTIDVNEIVGKVDIDPIIDRVDVNAIVNRVDIDAITAQTDLGVIIARSTTGVLTEALDLIRSQGVGLDLRVHRRVQKALRRQMDGAPAGPGTPGVQAAPQAGGATVAARSASPDRDVSFQGHFAGGITRFAAYAIDASASTALFAILVAVFGYAAEVVVGYTITLSGHPVVGMAVAILWYFAWFFYPWALTGRTLGMAVLGIRVVRSDGTDLGPRRAFVRAVTFPLSFLLFGLGFLGLITDIRHRGWHDRFADSVVVYAWDARAARLRFLAKPDGGLQSPGAGRQRTPGAG